MNELSLNKYTRDFVKHGTRYSFIFIGFLLVIAAFIGVSFVSYQQMQAMSADLSSVIRSHDLRVQLAHTMRNNARERSLLLLEMSRNNDPFKRDDLYMQLRSKGEIFLNAREQILQTEPTKKELELLELQRRYSRIAGPMQYNVVDMLNQGNTAEAQQFLLEQAIPAQNKVLKTLDLFIEQQREHYASVLEATSHNFSRSVTNLITLTSLGIAVSTLIAAFVLYRLRGVLKLQLDAERALLISNRDLEKRVTKRTQDLQKANEKLTRLARYDSITQLPNRVLFQEVSQMMLSRTRRTDSHLYIFFLDLDGFKQINDTYGHETGDALLHQVGLRIQRLTRHEDLLARIGGDEFALVLGDTNHVEHMKQVASKIILAISEPFDVQSHICHIGISIGISQFPEDGHNMTDLLRYADQAMYHSKKSGKNSVTLYRDIQASQT